LIFIFGTVGQKQQPNSLETGIGTSRHQSVFLSLQRPFGIPLFFPLLGFRSVCLSVSRREGGRKETRIERKQEGGGENEERREGGKRKVGKKGGKKEREKERRKERKRERKKERKN